MSSPPDDHVKLLADAKLMAGYAVRLGRLPNKAILAAIERLETMIVSDKAHPSAVADLSAEMNALARVIAPVTLMDLGSDWEPYPRHRYDALIRPLIAGFSAVLIAVLAYFSFIYTEARITSGALASLQAEDVAAKSEHLYDHWMTVQANIPPKSIAQHDDANSYYHEVDLLKAMQDHLDQYTTTANSLFDRSNPATFVVFIGRAVAPRDAAAATAPPPKPPATGAGATAAPPPAFATPVDANLSLTSSEIAQNNDARADYKELVSTPVDPAPPAARTAADATPALRPAAAVNPTADYYNSIAQYLSQIGISDIYRDDNNSVENRISTSIRICNDFITIYGLWVLPALYGLFGAMVYHLRSMMNPLIATPNLIAVRGALAMMAGVSISWIFSSLAAGGAGGPPGGITVFGLAFLFGYSIDIFFAALDKVVASVSSWAPKPR